MDEEVWRLVPSEPYLEVSDLGRVRSIDHHIVVPASSGHKLQKSHRRFCRGRLFHPARYSTGYLMVTVSSIKISLTKRKIRRRSVHSLVLEAFAGIRPSKAHLARHLDGNSLNNRLNNLRWGVPKENVQDRTSHGRSYRPQGELHHCAKLQEWQVKAIRKAYRRYGKEHIQLAAEFGITGSTARQIAKGQGWRHMP